MDHTRVVKQVSDRKQIALVKPYLITVQANNIAAVNDALNGLYISEEDYESLRVSIDSFDAYDALSLATRLETHALLEFRRIASYMFKKNGKWAKSVALSKQDKLYKDAMETSAESGDREVCEDLLRFFLDGGLDDCFAAALFSCYDFVRPDVVLELAWRHKKIDLSMPFFVQFLRETTLKLDAITDEADAKKAAEKKAAAEAAAAANTVAEVPYYHPAAVQLQVTGMLGHGMVPMQPTGMMPMQPMGGYAQPGVMMPGMMNPMQPRF